MHLRVTRFLMSTVSMTNPLYKKMDAIFQEDEFPNELSTRFKKGLQINDIKHPVMPILVTRAVSMTFGLLGGL